MNSAEATKTRSSFVLMGYLRSYRKDSDSRIHQCKPRSRFPTLNATIHGYQTRYQPGIRKSSWSPRH